MMNALKITSLVLILLLKSTWSFIDVDLSPCFNKEKSCMISSSCSTGTNCDFGASWIRFKDKSSGIEYLEVELMGKVTTGGYVTIGFSNDRSMGDDLVVGCFESADRISARVAYNEGDPKSNYFLDDAKMPTDYLTFTGDERLGGKFNKAQKLITCRFRILYKVDISEYPNLKDFTNEKDKVYIMMARGKMDGMERFPKHFSGTEIVSQDNVMMDKFANTIPENKKAAKRGWAKFHACLMILAWMLFCSVGVIMARYYKDMWPNRGIIGERVWFQTHRFTQLTVLFLVIISTLVIFISVGGWSSNDTWPFSAHPIIGIIAIILTLVNPLISICRCKPQSDNRPWFNWIHFFVGTIAYVLSVMNIIIGLKMPEIGFPLISKNYPTVIMIIFVLFQFCVELILEIHGCLYYKRNKDKHYNYEMQLADYEMRSQMTPPPTHMPQAPQPSGRMFKYFMFGVHFIGVCIFAFVMIIIIAVN